MSLRSNLIRLAHTNPTLRPHLLQILTSADKTAGTYVPVRELPVSVQRALKDIGYGRRDIEIMTATTFTFQSFADDGRRDFTTILNMETGQHKTTKGSYGGVGLGAPNPTDSDDRKHPIPSNAAIIQGSEGHGPTFAMIKVHPDNMATLIPAKVELSHEEDLVVAIITDLKPGYRAESFDRFNLGLYRADNPIVKGLVDKGLVKVTGTGIQITTAGKNARNPRVRV